MTNGINTLGDNRDSRSGSMTLRTVFLCSVMVVLFFVRMDKVHAQVATLGIFSDASDLTMAVEATSPTHGRSRAVTVDLFDLRRIGEAGTGALTLNLFDNAVFIGQVDHVADRPDGYSLSGTLEGQVRGQFDLTIDGGVVAGSIRDDANRRYHIRLLKDGTQVVRQINPAAFPPCNLTPQTKQRFNDVLSNRVEGAAVGNVSTRSSGSVSSADNGSVLDLLVLYSNVTRLAAGGTSAIRAEIQLAVDVANAAYVASGIGSRLRLVHMDEVTYDEVTGWDGFLDHLTRLWDPDDGYFDHAHDLRNLYGADLVSLIVEDSFSGTIGVTTCGIAPVMQEMLPEFESLALSAVNRECSADNWTLAHEIGHNQGCAHNRENSSVAGLYTYSYGHRFMGNTQAWRSIMAYDGAEGWERIGNFSNPYVVHDGVATGVPIGSPGEAHNVNTINSSRVTVARFRTTRYWVDFDWSGVEEGLFDSPFSELLGGLEAVPEGGMVVVKSGSSNERMILSKPLQINSWNGATVIGAASP